MNFLSKLDIIIVSIRPFENSWREFSYQNEMTEFAGIFGLKIDIYDRPSIPKLHYL